MGTTERRPAVHCGATRRVYGREFAAESSGDGTGVAVVGPEVGADAHDVIVGTEEAGGRARRDRWDGRGGRTLRRRRCGVRPSITDGYGAREWFGERHGWPDKVSRRLPGRLSGIQAVESRAVASRCLPTGRCAPKKYGVAASTRPHLISFRELMLDVRVERSEVVPGFVRCAADSDGRAHAGARGRA